MNKNKDEYLNILEKLKNIYLKYNNDDFVKKIDNLINDINNYKTKIILVGKFNAGKTALLNRILKRYVLEENTSPETSIAAELRYTNTEEYAEFIMKDGSSLKKTLKEALENKINSNDFQYSIYYLNSDFIHNNQDFILVDMPGIDSSIENHNKAIMQYIDQAGGYILVVSSEVGDIDEYSTNFILELKNYTSSLGVMVTKTELKLQDETEKIFEKVKMNAYKLFGKEVKCEYTFANDPNIEDKILNLINSMDFENIFINKYKYLLNDIIVELKSYIEEIKESLYFNDYDINLEIKNLEDDRKNIEEHFLREEKKLHNKLFNEDIPNIMSDIESELINNSSHLTELAVKGDKKNFDRCIVDIVRPILIVSVNENVNNSFGRFIEGLQMNTKDDINSKEITEHINTIFKSVNDIFKKYKSDDEDSIKKDKKDDKNNKDGNYSYGSSIKNILTILSITTDVVAPWIELLIVFLPDILNLLSFVGKNIEFENAKSKMVNYVIPKIVSKMQKDVEKGFKQIETDEVKKIREKANEIINQKINAVKLIRDKSNQDRKEYQNKLNQIDEDIKYIEELLY